MSYDVFLQRFKSGDSAPADSSIIGEGLAPYLANGAGEDGFGLLRFPDGEAEFYRSGKDWSDGFMVSHISGCQVWDVLFEVAIRAHLAILPVGCPTVVTSPAELDNLPFRLKVDAVVLHSGAELLASIENS